MNGFPTIHSLALTLAAQPEMQASYQKERMVMNEKPQLIWSGNVALLSYEALTLRSRYATLSCGMIILQNALYTTR